MPQIFQQTKMKNSPNPQSAKANIIYLKSTHVFSFKNCVGANQTIPDYSYYLFEEDDQIDPKRNCVIFYETEKCMIK